MDDLAACIVNRWVHAWEEDRGPTRTYRPQGSQLRPSRRPRQVLEFDEDGRFVSRTGGPTDALLRREGRWEICELSRLTVQWKDGDDATLEIVACSEQVLELLPVTGSI